MTDSALFSQALLVVDVQRAGVTGDRAVPGAAALLERTADLIARARHSGALVVHLQNDGAPGTGDEPHTPGWALHLPVEAGPMEVVLRKTRDDGFAGTPLGDLLTGAGVESLVVCGVMSEMCVQATARTALALNYRVVLPYDAHATQDIPAAPGISAAVPAATVSRVAAWAIGAEADVTTPAADVRFTAPRPESSGTAASGADVDSLLAAYDRNMRGAPPNPPAGVHYEWDGELLRIAGQFRGFVTTPRDVGVRGAALDRLIARQRDHFAARGEAVEWKTRGHDLPDDLTDRLRAAGFVPEEQETIVIGPADDMAADPVLPDGVTLRQVTAEADMRRIAAMESVVWGEDRSWLGDDLVARVATAPDEIAVFVAEAGGEVVAAAWLVFRTGTEFAGLWGGSTLAAWRGRGIYRALVATRAQLAVARGTRFLQVDASDDSAPILRRLGFHAVTTTTPYVWTPQPA